MGLAFLDLLDRLLAALEAARAALVVDAAEDAHVALDDAFSALGTLYAILDSGDHPELSAYLQTCYDRCLQKIGDAGPGHYEGLGFAITLLRHIQRAQAALENRAL